MEGKEKKEEKRSQREDDARGGRKGKKPRVRGWSQGRAAREASELQLGPATVLQGPRWPRAPCDFASLQDVDCDIGGGWPSPALAINRGRKHSPRTLPLGPARKPPCLKRIF